MKQEIEINNLINHILVMADDPYLEGHPEWVEIVQEARAIAWSMIAGYLEPTPG